MRYGGRRCEFAIARDQRLDTVGCKHLERTFERGRRQCVRVDTEIKRTADFLLLPILANRLGDREHVPLVECPVK